MERYGRWQGREGWSGRWDRDDEERRRWRDPGDERWSRDAGPELDPPWVERGPARRRPDEGRGLVEWEDRGPLEWLGARAREATARPRGPKGYTRTDERIRDDVCERFARSGVDVDDVEVKVEGAEVTLVGTVRSRQEKWWLEQLADDVFGVDDVHNGLRIARPAAERGAEGSLPRRDDPHAPH